MLEPRRPTSSLKRSVELPGDARDTIAHTFRDAFQEKASGYEILVDGRVFSEEVLLSVSLKKSGEITQKNFVASLDYDTQNDQAMKIIHTAVDAIASMIEQFLEAGLMADLQL